MKKLLLFSLAFLLLALGPALYAQTVSGNIAVTIQDKSGAAVPKATVTALNPATGFSKTATANDNGELLFSDLPIGSYNITATAAGFAKQEKTGFTVQLNRQNSATFIMDVQTQSVTLEVTGAAPPINTTTSQIEGTFESRETADLPTASIGLGVVNLALLQPGVTTSGGVGYGTGPSVAGQRPTNNNFTIEGVDNNNKSVTGPVAQVPNDAVAEFSTLQNDYSPEFGHSNGGQFNQTVVAGTNAFHGKLYEYNQNRYYNATDQQAIVSQQDPQRPRFDFNRLGGQLGGPILKDKLFFFANYEYDPLGQASIPAGGLCAPTAAGYATIAALPTGLSPDTKTTNALNANNLGILQKYVAASPASSSGTCPFTQGNLAAGAVANPLYICTGGATPSGVTNKATGVTTFSCPTGTVTPVDVGVLGFNGPNFSNTYFLTTHGDYNMSSKDQFRLTYIYNRANFIDNAAQLPAFYQPIPQRDHLVALNEYHTFRPDLTNELRLGYNRFSNITPSGNFTFPGLDQFPNLIFFDINAQLGPDGNAPQFGIQNVYSGSENLNWSHKNHNLRVGVDVRRYIAPNSFTQRARGDYDYNSLGGYLYDVNPDFLAERSTGSLIYYGDLIDTGWYINDTWRIKPSFSLNYGMRYEYATIPFGERLQSINSAASVQGLAIWQEPSAPKNQFMPRAGFAWSPDKDRTWSIRGGLTMGYDVLYDNLGLNSISAGAVPQFGATVDQPQSAGVINNFLANGAIPAGTGGFNTFIGCAAPCGTAKTGETATAQQQRATAGLVPRNINNPVAITGTLGVQHVFWKNYTAEVRYVYTHGYHLPTQIQINKQVPLGPNNFLPTYLTAPTAAQLGALNNSLALIENPALFQFVPQFVSGCASVAKVGLPDGFNKKGQVAPCFTSNITAFEQNGNSVYHGLAMQLTRRFEHGLQVNASYTYSHAIDDSTPALFSTVITPRRAQDGLNINNDRSNSALDHRHRVTLVAYYDMPYFKTGSWFRRNVLGNWIAAPVYTYQSGEWADVHASADTNLNGDTAGDRVLLNPAGIGSTGTGATATCLAPGNLVVVGSANVGTINYSCATVGNVTAVAAANCAAPNTACFSVPTVAYTAGSATAKYIKTGAGGLVANNGLVVAGRNTLLMRPINNIDLTLGKKFNITERFRFEFQAQFLNFINHPQYIAGSINQVNAIGYTGTSASNYLNPANSAFNDPTIPFSSNPRTIQLTAKLVF